MLIILPGILPAQGEIQTIAKYLEKNRSKWNLTSEDLQGMEISDQYQSSHNQIRHIYIRQSINGVGVDGTETGIHLLPDGRIVIPRLSFIPDIAGKAESESPVISPTDALQSAMDQLGISPVIPLKLVDSSQTGQIMVFSDGGISLRPIPVRMRFLVMDDSRIVPVWNLQIYMLDGNSWKDIRVNGITGEIADMNDWVISCSHQNLSPNGPNEYHVFAEPVESPSFGPRAYIFDPSDSFASPFGWHDTDGVAGAEFTNTRGNNVWASADHNATNTPGFSPDGGPALDFDFPLDLSQPPGTYTSASVTNLFYWNNLMHDVWYQYGFDEVSGNFQMNNYGRGGIAGDFVIADAQDGAARNNANFATPPDSANGRMQMFLWGGGTDTLSVIAPGTIAGNYDARVSSFGPSLLHASPVNGQLVIAVDGNGDTRACNAIANTAGVQGKIALIDRGLCDFTNKVFRAQQAGAIGVVVVNNSPGPPEPMWFNGSQTVITIPSMMISQTHGNAIKNELNNGGAVNAVMLGFDMLNNPGIIDSDFDNGVVAHEYGHGISNRLTGGPSTSACLSNQEQAGEGWSDWFALVMTHVPGDQADDPRPIGTFMVNEPTDGPGIRNFPYSRDMNVNPLTYNDIKTLSIPHGVGHVMATMLWDLYWDLIDQYGYDADLYHGTGGNNIAMQLVMDGLKLQPCSPGFTDVRDAILLADAVNNGGANECLIWKAFARRGLGFSADQGSPNDRSDGTEAFDLPVQCQPILAIDKVADIEWVSKKSVITYTITIQNQTEQSLTNVVITDTLVKGLDYISGSASCGVTEVNDVLILNIGSMAPGQVMVCTFEAELEAKQDESILAFHDDFENLTGTYVPIAQVGVNGFVADSTNPRSGSVAWFVPNAPALNDQILMMPSQTFQGSPVLSFWHSYNTEEEWDGGLVEILPTITGNGNWTDLGSRMIENGYDSKVGVNNPAGERPAFSGNSRGYRRTKIDLSDFAGEPVFIRFRFVSDDNTSQTGWWIDDILVTNGPEVNLTNTACVSSTEEPGSCDQLDVPHLIVKPQFTAIEGELPEASVKLFPNPTTGKINIEVSGVAGRGLEVFLYNPFGQQVWRGQSPGNRLSTHLPRLPEGLYLIYIKTGRGYVWKKLKID